MAQHDRRSGRSGTTRQDEAPSGPRGQETVAAKGKDLKKVMDEVLEDIDDVLEENSEGFVKGYVQRGGE